MPERRAALSGGCPGVAVSLDLEAYDKRRTAMFTLLQVAAGVMPFGAWVPYSESIGRSKSEKLELHLKVLYDLLRDVLVLRESSAAKCATKICAPSWIPWRARSRSGGSAKP